VRILAKEVYCYLRIKIMRTSFKSIAKNFSSSLMANLVNAGATVVAILIVSKFFSVADFSYWQLYIFYVNYAGLFHLGWTDGVYLRYGGKNYEDLDTGRLGTQFWLLLATQLVISIIAALLTTLFVDERDQHSSHKIYIAASTRNLLH
jgi:O-antigen/teichoic acid export membrane protein